MIERMIVMYLSNNETVAKKNCFHALITKESGNRDAILNSRVQSGARKETYDFAHLV